MSSPQLIAAAAAVILEFGAFLFRQLSFRDGLVLAVSLLANSAQLFVLIHHHCPLYAHRRCDRFYKSIFPLLPTTFGPYSRFAPTFALYSTAYSLFDTRHAPRARSWRPPHRAICHGASSQTYLPRVGHQRRQPFTPLCPARTPRHATKWRVDIPPL